MEILFVTSEVAPFSRVGGLGDACGALPKALRGLGHKVTVLSPLYPGIDPSARSLARRLIKVEMKLGGKTVACELYDGRTSAGVDLLFLGHEELFRRVPHVYGEGETYLLDAQRFAALSYGAMEILRAREPRFDLVHAHDWPAALAVFAIKRDRDLSRVPTVLTIHDLAHQGTFPKETVDTLGLSWDDYKAEGFELFGQLSLLKAGLLMADRITTVSPTYAKEIQTPERGHRLDGLLRARKDKVVGILDGIDVAVWGPATDSHLARRYDPFALEGKAICRADLQSSLGLPVRADVPVLVTLGRLTAAKGYDLFAKALPQLLRADLQVIVHGAGDEELLEVLREQALRFPDRLVVKEGWDDVLVHKLAAGSDLVLVPSRNEPCGLFQRVAHRYGAIPVVHHTGGLADTVIDCDAKLESGSGFVFDEPTPQSLLAAVRRGLAAFALGASFDGLRRRVMRIDHSWERSARLYEALYKELLTPPSA